MSALEFMQDNFEMLTSSAYRYNRFVFIYTESGRIICSKKNKEGEGSFSVSFDEFFNSVDMDMQKKLLYNLDVKNGWFQF